MKNRFYVMLIAVMLLAVSCEEEAPIDDQAPDNLKELSELKLTLQSIRNANTNNTYKFGAMAMGFNGKKKSLKCDSACVDTLYWDDWETCAEIDYFTDDEGFEVMVMDYGDEGCMEYGELIKGKITWKWKMDENGWEYVDIYENYSGWGMTINGYYKGVTTWTGSTDWTDFEDSTYFYDWFDEDYEEISINEEDMTISFEDGEEIYYVSTFKSKFTFDSYTILEGNFSSESNSGDSYTWNIVEPVVSNFDCEYWIPVSGIEEGAENENTFRFDYGDGTCDNKYTITINGVTEEIEVDEDDFWICEIED